MGTSTPKERAFAIETLASALSQLRDSAGNPSFRVMAGRSGAISHTTLHEAAQGNRLPSWETTTEFVKACGADPADYRAAWERADHVVARHDEASTKAGPAGSDEAQPRAEPSGSPPSTTRGRWYAVGGLALLGAVALGVWMIWSPNQTAQPDPADARAPSASECPINQTNPPPAPPAHEGDHAEFVADVTLPDCTRVEPGERIVKTWRFKNAGTVSWEDYTLHRIDPQGQAACQTVPEVPIPDTAPGDIVDVTTTVTVPDTAGFCFVRFKMRDASGADAFPAGRPVYFQLIVE